MNNKVIEIDGWLAGVMTNNGTTYDDWEPCFDADRQLVISMLGPYKKVFPRPAKFAKQFYHTIFPLHIEEWRCTDQVKLYDAFCTIDIALDIRFQPTYEYVLNHLEDLSELYRLIKNAYQGQILDIVNRELLNLSDGYWVQEGLESVEKSVCQLVNEMLILQNIQSQVVCKLEPDFEEFPDVHFAKESVYLSVIKKNFECSKQQKEELFRQQQEEEKQKIEHKRKQFKNLNEIADLNRQKQVLHADHNKHLLEDKELQQLEAFKIRKKIHADKIKHNNSLKEIALIEELKEKQNQQALIRASDEQNKTELIEHQMKLKEQELGAEIAEYEKEQKIWRDAKSKTHAEELDQKNRQRQLEFDTEVGYKQRYEQQRIAMQEESYVLRKNADTYLKREIELLELEKKRLALQLTIKDYKDKEKQKDKEDEK